MTARELIDRTLQDSRHGSLEVLEVDNWLDCQPDFETAHFINGFAHADGKFHFRPDWSTPKVPGSFQLPEWENMPELPDHWDVIENADREHPFRLVTAPSRSFLNTSFTETPSGQKHDGTPTAFIHPEDMQELHLKDDDEILMGNKRGEIVLTAKSFTGLQRGVVIVEGIVPNRNFADGRGINSLTSADQVAPYGGAAFHDNHVWIRKAAS